MVSLIALFLITVSGYFIFYEYKRPHDSFKDQPKPAVNNKSGIADGFQNTQGMKFVYIPEGDFMMGSPVSDIDRDEDETLNLVKISTAFYMQTTEVTQAQWSAVMGSNPSSFKSCGPECPVESLSWEMVQLFIQRLNETSKDFVYRLPTEAEWEYACRAGTNTSIYKGDIKITNDKDATLLDEIGWYGGNSCVGYGSAFDCSKWENREKTCSTCGTHPVAMKEANAWGLYDMIGNVSEWCSDWYGAYQIKDSSEYAGPLSGSQKVFRGGAWYFDARFCRSAARSKAPLSSRFFFLGFRLAADREKDAKPQ